MRIHQVDTSERGDVNRFIRVPFPIYQGCPQWVPPMLPDARFQLNRKKNPFYQRNDAAFFVAERDGEDVGRIAVLHPRFFNEFKGLSNAHFYLFESIDDQAIANALLDAGREWAAARGLAVLRGPLGFMALDGFGMLAEGFEHRPALGIPYNHAYYPRLAETWGFELEERVLSGYLNVRHMLSVFPQRVLDIAEKVKARYGFDVVTFKTKRELKNWVAPRLADIYNRTLTHIAGDPPLSQEEVAAVADNVLLVTDPRLFKFITKNGEVIGFLFCFLDISAAIQKVRGRLFPFGFIHLLRELGRTNWINLNGMGILPEYQGMGGTAVMYAELYHTVQRFPRFEHADVVQISEFNPKSLNEMKQFGIDFYKTHHIYRREI
jgi:hypothetical protein